MRFFVLNCQILLAVDFDLATSHSIDNQSSPKYFNCVGYPLNKYRNSDHKILSVNFNIVLMIFQLKPTCMSRLSSIGPIATTQCNASIYYIFFSLLDYNSTKVECLCCQECQINVVRCDKKVWQYGRTSHCCHS